MGVSIGKNLRQDLDSGISPVSPNSQAAVELLLPGSVAGRWQVRNMRYANAIVISEEQDIPLLRHVRNCRLVTRQQLFKLLRHEVPCISASVYSWRINRLIRGDYIRRVEAHPHVSSALYSISRLGLLELESHSDYCLSCSSKTQRMPHSFQINHCLGLTEIRLSLMRSSLLVNWKSEVEIASENLIYGTFQKDYDAVVTIYLGQETHTFGLEYECSLKNPRRYELIRTRLEYESALASVLYVAATPRLARLLALRLTPASKPVAICPAQSFHQQLLEAPVMTNIPNQVVALNQFLTNAWLGPPERKATLQ